MPRGFVVIEFLDLMLAHYRYVLLRRQLALAEALACNALRHIASALQVGVRRSYARDRRLCPGDRWPPPALRAQFRDKNVS